MWYVTCDVWQTKRQFFLDSVYVSQRETNFFAYGELKGFLLAIQNQTQVAIIGIL